MVISSNWAVALASTFALWSAIPSIAGEAVPGSDIRSAMWSAIPSVAGAAVPGSGIRSAIQKVAVQSNPITNVRQGNCGPWCSPGRSFNRGPQSRSGIRTGQAPRRYQGRSRGNAAIGRNFNPGPQGRSRVRTGSPPRRYQERSRGNATVAARRNVRPVYGNQNGGHNAYRYRGPRNQVTRVYRRGNFARSNSYHPKRRAYRNNRNHGQRSYRNYGHYKKHCRRYCGRYKHRHRRYSYYYDDWWYAWPWWSLSVPIYVYAQDNYQYDDLHVAYCLGKYRSYNPATDTYLAYSGRYRRCRSPYSG
jgi:hypothetical protein